MMKIRLVNHQDAEDILAIYAHFVRNTAITFETEVPDLEAFRDRIVRISAVYPYLVWEEDRKIRAFAYASRFREREAYRFDVETSVYADQAFHGRGIGRALYTTLLRIVEELGYYTAYGLITLPNEKSIGLHQAVGFRHVGVYHKTGFKLGEWWDVALLEKNLREYDKAPHPPKKIAELASLKLDTIHASLKLDTMHASLKLDTMHASLKLDTMRDLA